MQNNENENEKLNLTFSGFSDFNSGQDPRIPGKCAMNTIQYICHAQLIPVCSNSMYIHGAAVPENTTIEFCDLDSIILMSFPLNVPIA